MKKIIIGILAVAVIGAGAYILFGSNTEVENNKDAQIQEVETKTVSELSVDSEPVIAYGQVISSDSVAVVPEKSGIVKRVNKSLGQTVQSGEVVIELQNSSEQQAVLQARSSLASAQAQLIRAQEGTDIEDIQSAEFAVQDRERQLEDLQSQLRQTALSVASAIRTSIYGEYDTFFRTPTDDASLIFATPNISDTRQIDAMRDELQNTVDEFISKQFPVPTSRAQELVIINDVRAYISEYQSNVDALIELIESQSKSIISENTKSAYITTLNAIKVSTNAQAVTINNSSNALSAARSAIQIAQNNLDKLNEDPDTQGVTIAQSGVTSAQAGLSSAQIELSKTFITSPTFGRISSIETRVGQLVGPQNQIFVVSSSGSKRIDVFVSESEAAQITVGSSATINDSIPAQVARVSPTIDSNTGKIKVELFPTEQTALVEGAGVRVRITTASKTNNASAGFAIPIEAVFVRGETTFVYIIRDGKAVPQAIQTGGLFGPTVKVVGGIEASDEIVVFARGVKDNQIIRVEATENTQESTQSVEITETE